MSNFIKLHEIIQHFQTDPATQNDPGKCIFICDGKVVTAYIAASGGDESELYTQPDHDGIVIVIDGDAEFRVANETRHVRPGDFIFNTAQYVAWSDKRSQSPCRHYEFMRRTLIE